MWVSPSTLTTQSRSTTNWSSLPPLTIGIAGSNCSRESVSNTVSGNTSPRPSTWDFASVAHAFNILKSFRSAAAERFGIAASNISAEGPRLVGDPSNSNPTFSSALPGTHLGPGINSCLKRQNSSQQQVGQASSCRKSVNFSNYVDIREYNVLHMVEGSSRSHMLKHCNWGRYATADWAEVHKTLNEYSEDENVCCPLTGPTVKPGSEADKCLINAAFKAKVIADTGSGHHIVCYDSLSAQERENIRKSAVKLRLSTANGVIEVENCVDVFIGPLQTTVTCMVLLKSPAVISVGRFC